jgi:ABC-type uncharacterized transport system auxiliary subunit
MKALVAALGSAVLLSGCVSVLPQPFVPTALIALPADRATAPASPLQADVAVFPPDSSRAFAGADIAVRSAQELVYLGEVRWSDAAPHLLQGAVVNALTQAGGPGRAVPAELGAEVDYDVRWRIVDLSAGSETSPGNVEVQVSLMDSHTRRMVAQQTFRTQSQPADRAPRARAAALALATQQVADQVADFVAKTVPAKQSF